jgi:hypothetical protein
MPRSEGVLEHLHAFGPSHGVLQRVAWIKEPGFERWRENDFFTGLKLGSLRSPGKSPAEIAVGVLVIVNDQDAWWRSHGSVKTWVEQALLNRFDLRSLQLFI